MVDVSAVARVLGIATEFKDLRAGSVLFLPQRIAVFAQGSSAVTYSTDKRQVTSAAEAGTIYGFDGPIGLITRELLPVNGDGVGSIPVTIYPLEDGYEAVAAAGDITPGGTASKASTFRVRVSGYLSNEFVVPAGAVNVANTVAAMVTAINAVLHMPVTATDGTTKVDLDATWAGPTGNDLVVEIIGDLNGVTFAITQPAGGLVDPDITDALAQMGNVWETMAIQSVGLATDAILDEFQTFGEGRWGELVRKPLVIFAGDTTVSQATATTVSDARTDDRVNAQLVAPGSVNLPFVVAARQLARIAKVANNNPPRDYGSQKATGLLPGDDGDQWDYPTRDAAVKNGSSTIEVRDGVVNISDVVTFYHPVGEEPPAYRYVCDIVKLQNIIFNIDLLFANEEWDGAPLIPDDQPTVNPSARKPKSAKSLVNGLLDNLGLQAIISDPATAKANTTAVINSGNPKRLDIEVLVQLAGNTNIISVGLSFGFFFGSQAAVA
jgi:phage tail sheath gpL-like